MGHGGWAAPGSRPDRRRGIAARFWVVLAVLVPSLLSVAAVGLWGIDRTTDAATFQYTNNILAIRAADGLRIAISDARDTALRTLATDDVSTQRALQQQLVSDRMPAVEADFVRVRQLLDAADRPAIAHLAEMRAAWRAFAVLVAEGRLGDVARDRSAISSQVATALDVAVSSGQDISTHEAREAKEAHQRALAQRDRSVLLMAVVLVLALTVGAGAVVWLIRTVLPRTIAYSRFAARVAEGDDTPMDDPSGDDEIAQLGHVLQDMAARGRSRRLYEQTQLEFSETLQLTEDESEAHGVLKRHLERTLTSTEVTVLNRNNSADRLEAVTAVGPDTPLAVGLTGAKPRSCLAVRQARTHRTEPGTDALVACQVCGDCPSRSTCTPLLVSGEVIGSVLALHDHELDDESTTRIRESVAQAAPVLANLRNLAIAELRASTDALTGLPNKRAASDNLKQLVAQALRNETSLAVLMLDLDHFKHINDRLGHARGDEVLATVGAALRSTCRDSDFVGRYGGEEFIVLLPDMTTDGALVVAEKIRTVIAEVYLSELDRPLTASIGLAMMPEHGADPTTVERAADNALYAAKRNGRNRIEAAGGWEPTSLFTHADTNGVQ